MTISKEQWKEIETKLSGILGAVDFICDGYKVSAQVHTHKMKLVVSVYVDGFIKGEHIFNMSDSEIPRKFHQEKKRFVFGGKYRALLIKKSKTRGTSKEFRDSCIADAKKTSSHYWPHWSNAAAFCRHIRKTCTSIEIVKIGY